MLLLLLAAPVGCGNSWEDHDWNPQGTVTFDGAPVGDILVCATQGGYSECGNTNYQGSFYIYVDDAIRHEAYEVCVWDMDGTSNGGSFESQCQTVDPYTPEPVVDFALEEVTP